MSIKASHFGPTGGKMLGVSKPKLNLDLGRLGPYSRNVNHSDKSSGGQGSAGEKSKNLSSHTHSKYTKQQENDSNDYLIPGKKHSGIHHSNSGHPKSREDSRDTRGSSKQQFSKPDHSAHHSKDNMKQKTHQSNIPKSPGARFPISKQHGFASNKVYQADLHGGMHPKNSEDLRRLGKLGQFYDETKARKQDYNSVGSSPSPEVDSTGRRQSNQQVFEFSEEGGELNELLNQMGHLSDPSSKRRISSHAITSEKIFMLLEEKNKEIEKLAKEKQNLEKELRFIAQEVQNVAQMKKVSQEKDHAIDKLQESLQEAVLESQELRKELKRLQLQSPEKSQEHEEHQQQQEVTSLINQLKELLNEEGHSGRSADFKSRLLELLQKQNNPQLLKKPEFPYMLSNLEYRTERNSNPVNFFSSSRLYQRNYSAHIDEGFGRKLSLSPYYETILDNTRKISDSKKSLPSSTKSSKSANQSKKFFKRSELKETVPRHINNYTPNQNEVFLSQNRGNLDFETTHRKFSHEHKASADNRGTYKLNGSLNRKESHQEVSSHNFEFSEALSHLKERIKTLLDKHRIRQIKLTQMNQTILRKLEQLGISPD